MPATLVKCACAKCSCDVDPATAVSRDGRAYCSEACATGHPNHEPCHGGQGCGCSCGS
ncbi:conjugal transfer protein TrbI [Synechococcus sp. RSCCF101]|uniref:metallothionein n=1 Tax=Synechococcus sp. RSCCF101 TaxID=2511069 RepID=UPI001247BCAB|nr:metallothionein [Synechococcus sp. RSCCF101]QEY33004.1 conjugal transfer protein TrbI [Synechococcus sp. RSCCF101]